MEQISLTVDTWVSEDEIPFSPTLKIIRRSDPWYGMSEEEIEDAKEFIRCHLLKDHETILQIPIQAQENDFWAPNHQDFLESAFNTWDYQRTQKPFDKYAWRIKKVLEKIKDLAMLHSSISQPEGKANIQRRYETVVDNEFRDRLPSLFQRYQKAWTEEQRNEIRGKVAELNRRIMQCKKVWEEYANWE
jgi:replicative DNA helicase